MSDHMMRVALVQMKSTVDKQDNIRRALDLAGQALGSRKTSSKFILFPEYFNYRGPLDKNVLADVAEDLPGPSSAPFMAFAKAHRVHLLLGSLYERIPGSRKAYNTSVMIGPDGRIKAVYRKQNLFELVLPGKHICEADHFKPGTCSSMTKVGKFSVGMSLCFDVRFPSIYEGYAAKGATVFTAPSAFSRMTGRAHWELLVRTRAVETFSYMLAPNQASPCWGHSMIVSPWGEVLTQGSGHKEEVLRATLDLNAVARVRQLFGGYKKLKKVFIN